jgi:site-specific DNA recombinase
MAGRSKASERLATVNCAIYTRKSAEEGLNQDFNSLDAQREAGEAYIASQKAMRWTAVSAHYADGGYPGANMERPGLKRLLEDVRAGQIDTIVVYKVDRLTRSMKDFFKIMEILDNHGVTFVSVTQQFNTTTSIGRLALNIVMSFSEFERETISERTRDKMRAARRRGKWIGGNPPLGYDVAPSGGALVVNVEEAEHVQQIFQLYRELGSLIPVIQELDRRDWRMKAWTTREGRTRGGARFKKNTLHKLLTTVVYTGRIRFQDQLWDGDHERIVTDEVWNAVQERLHRNGRRGGRSVRNAGQGLLQRLVRCDCGAAMIHTYTKKGVKLYRYYVCRNAQQRGWNQCRTRSVSAPELEAAVVAHLRGCGQHPEVVSAALKFVPDAEPRELQKALAEFDGLWEHLTTWEKEQFIRDLVSEVRYEGPTQSITVTFHSNHARALCCL